MSQEYSIVWVGDPREWSNKRGDRFLAYPIKVEGDDREIEWSRKPDSDAPEIGKSTPLADIENGPHGPKLKVDWNAVKEQGGSTGSSGGSRNYGGREWQKETERDPERAARILRQHSQGVAVQMLIHCNKDGYFNVADVAALSDELDQDVIAAGQKAAQAGGGEAGNDPRARTSPSGTPGAQETQSNAEYLSKLLEQAGFPTVQIPPIQRYIESEVQGERRGKLETALGSSDLNVCARAVEQLIAETQSWMGEKLPAAGSSGDDDILF